MKIKNYTTNGSSEERGRVRIDFSIDIAPLTRDMALRARYPSDPVDPTDVFEELRSSSLNTVMLCNAWDDIPNFHACLRAVAENSHIQEVTISRCFLEPHMLTNLSSTKIKLNEVYFSESPLFPSPIPFQSLGLCRLTTNSLRWVVESLLSADQKLTSLSVRLRDNSRHAGSDLLELMLRLSYKALSFSNFVLNDSMLSSLEAAELRELHLVGCIYHPSGVEKTHFCPTRTRRLFVDCNIPIDFDSLIHRSAHLRKLDVRRCNGKKGLRMLGSLFKALESPIAQLPVVKFRNFNQEDVQQMEKHLPLWSSVRRLDFDIQRNNIMFSRDAFRRNSSIVRTNVTDPAIQWYTHERNRLLPNALFSAEVSLLPRVIANATSDVGPTLVAARLLTLGTEMW